MADLCLKERKRGGGWTGESNSKAGGLLGEEVVFSADGAGGGQEGKGEVPGIQTPACECGGEEAERSDLLSPTAAVGENRQSSASVLRGRRR